MLGRYTVVRLVGRGAMGEVYEAHDTALGRRVALKVLTFAPSDRQLEESIAVREGQMLALVRHPNVVAVFDVGVADGSTFIAIEFVEGTSLGEWVRSRSGPAHAASLHRIARQLAEGLAAIHEAGLIHRDIKPPNILVDEHGSARLADLGVAKLVIDMTPDSETTETTWVGTPGYWAPEVEAGSPATQASDVYALCASMLEVSSELPTSAAGRRLASILRRGCVPRPADRPTAEALASALRPKPTKWLSLAVATVAIATTTILAIIGNRDTGPSVEDQRIAEASRRLATTWTPEVAAQLRAWAREAPAPTGWQRREIVRLVEERAATWRRSWVAVAALGEAADLPGHRDCLALALARLEVAISFTLGHDGPADALLAWLNQTPSASVCTRSELYRGEAAVDGDADPATIAQLGRVLQADAAIYLGDLERARALLEEVENGPPIEPLEGNLAYLRGMLAFQADGSSSEALEHFRAAILAAEAHGDRVLLARATTQSSRMHGLAGRYDEARFAVARALAALGPRPEAELPTLWLLDAYARTEAAFGSPAGRQDVRQRLTELQPRLAPDAIGATLFHRASAYVWPEHAEEHWLAVWELASAELGPAHDLALNAQENYIRIACGRGSVTGCTEQYDAFVAASEGSTIHQGPAVQLVMQATALNMAGYDWAAWDLAPAILDALEGANPTAKLIAALAVSELAANTRVGAGPERMAHADAALAVVQALGLPQFESAARLYAASTASSTGDRRRAEHHIEQLEALPLPDESEEAREDRERLLRFARGIRDKNGGDSAAAVEHFERLQESVGDGATPFWYDQATLALHLCEASVGADHHAKVLRHCTAAADHADLPESNRQWAIAQVAVATLRSPD